MKRTGFLSRSPRLGSLPSGAGALLLAAAAFAQPSGGNLLVTPTRVVLEGRQRAAELTLVNTGSTTATYRITLIHLRMDEGGGTREIAPGEEEPGERFADDLVRYSPRQVTLEPNLAQTVRMQLRKPSVLETGEYRSHLLFRAVPEAAPTPRASAPAGRLSVQLNAVVGISIPVIVRQGTTAAQVALSGLALAPAGSANPSPTLRLQIHRSGNRSVYGNLTATFQPATGRPVIVGLANGVAVYVPNGLRTAVIPLLPPPGVALSKGVVHVAYTRQDPAAGALAEAELRLP